MCSVLFHGPLDDVSVPSDFSRRSGPKAAAFTVAALGVLSLVGCAPERFHTPFSPPFAGLPPDSSQAGFGQGSQVLRLPTISASGRTTTRPGPLANGPVVPAGATGPMTPAAGGPVTVDDLVRVAIERHPRLARATFAIDAAEGRRIQAGLYPNPVLAVSGEELGDRQGPSGIWTLPQVNQEIVTGRKLSLSQAVAAREVDQATLTLLSERYEVIGTVRAAFYEVYALELRCQILLELVEISEQAVVQGKNWVENKQMARIDLIPLEVELERYRAESESVERELPAAYQRLSTVTGNPRMAFGRLTGSFEELPPEYDLVKARELILKTHPDVRGARVGVERAQAAIERAEAEPIPNLTLSTGYMRQGQNKSNDWLLGVSAPVPLWNRNQGNIREARANFGIAIQDVARAENEVTERLAVAFRTYAAARRRAGRYRTELLPRAQESFDLAMKAFKGGQFEYLRVIQAQRAAAEARLELNRALGEAWRAAGEISGLLLEEDWPWTDAAPDPGAPPMMPPPEPPK